MVFIGALSIFILKLNESEAGTKRFKISKKDNFYWKNIEIVFFIIFLIIFSSLSCYFSYIKPQWCLNSSNSVSGIVSTISFTCREISFVGIRTEVSIGRVCWVKLYSLYIRHLVNLVYWYLLNYTKGLIFLSILARLLREQDKLKTTGWSCPLRKRANNTKYCK